MRLDLTPPCDVDLQQMAVRGSDGHALHDRLRVLALATRAHRDTIGLIAVMSLAPQAAAMQVETN